MRPTVNGNRSSDRRESSRKSEDREYLTASMESAAQEAAIADGIITGDSHDSKSKKAALRRGKWTSEEEAYANRLIYEFKLGLLPLNDGTTLRTFLSKLLNCDPMRISKKFVGQNCIGKQVFRRRQQDIEKLTTEQIALNQKELEELERKFLERVAQTNRSKSSGLKGFSDGRGYEDENGNTVLLPWMIPPEDNGEMALRAAHHLASVSGRSGGQQQGHLDNVMYSQQQQPAHGGSYHTNSGRGGGASSNQNGEGGDQVMSMEQYQQMNHFMASAAGQQYQYMQNLALHQMRESGYDPALHGNLDNPYEALMQMHAQDPHRQLPFGLYLQPSGMPHADQTPGSGTQPAGMDRLASTFSLGFTGTGQEWPSMNSLINSGESMENIAMFLAHYQTANSESNLLANADHMDVSTEGTSGVERSEGKAVSSEESSRNRSKSIDDVGLSLDDGHHPSSSSSSHLNGGAFTGRSGGGGSFQDKKPPLQFRPDQVRYSLPTDTMAAMAQMYGGTTEDRSKIALSNFSSSLLAPAAAAKAPAQDESPPKEGGNNSSSSSQSAMPRNSSVDNFWMLVDMGDLPRPEQDVLSEAVFAKNKATKAASRSNDQHADDNNGSEKRVSVPIVASSSLTTSRTVQPTESSSMSSSTVPAGSLAAADDGQQVGKKRATAAGEEAIAIPSNGNAHPDTLQSLSQGDISVSHEHLISAFSSHQQDSPFQSMKKIKIEPTDSR